MDTISYYTDFYYYRDGEKKHVIAIHRTRAGQVALELAGGIGIRTGNYCNPNRYRYGRGGGENACPSIVIPIIVVKTKGCDYRGMGGYARLRPPLASGCGCCLEHTIPCQVARGLVSELLRQ